MKWKIGNTTVDVLPPVKRYMNAIERRLRVDRKTKIRIMTELASDFQSRRESGQTDEAIMEELGTPEEVAAEFNEALDGDIVRPVPRWRWGFVALAVAVLLAKLILPQITWQMSGAGSIGIIGGADGPTSIFVSANAPTGIWNILPWLLGCAAGFLSAGWCRVGSPKRYAVPLVFCLLGLAQQVVLLLSMGYLYASAVPGVFPSISFGADFLWSFFGQNGSWLCLVVLVWTIWAWRRTRK